MKAASAHLHVDLCRPRKSSGAAELSRRSEAGSSDPNNFAFAFDDSNFSDRTLRIQIIPEVADDAKTNGEEFNGIPDWARKRKRRREDILITNVNGAKIVSKGSNAMADWAQNSKRSKEDVIVKIEYDADMITLREEQILNCNMPDSEEYVTYENRDEEAVAMVEETHAGVGLNTNQLGGATEGSDPLSSDPSTVLRVKTIHISSPILAAKSPFFYKLFSNGMRESEQRHVTLRIHASEEAALMDLLNFMYSNTSPKTSPPALLELLMAADKFEVASCMRYCSRVLRNIPMTSQSALLYLDLPSSVLMADAVQPLIEAAKQFLAARYKDFTKFYEEVLNLPLAGIEAVFASDELQIASEDAVYDFLLKWARIHYPKLEERKEILGTHLVRFIRFPFMTCRKLKRALTCVDLDSNLASKAVLDALFFKAEAPHRKCNVAADGSSSAHHRFVQRAYKYRPIKVVEFELPRQQCVVYLDLKREECANLFPMGRVYSQAFHLGGQGFFLSAHCNMDQQSLFPCFGLFLGMQEKGSVTFAVDYEFAARSKPTDEYVSKYKGNYTFIGGKAVGYRNLFGVPWNVFMAENGHYFNNGVLHLRAELTIRQ